MPADRFSGARVSVPLEPRRARLSARVTTLVAHQLSFPVLVGTWSAPRGRLDRSLIELEFDVAGLSAEPERVAEIARSPDFLDGPAFPTGRMTLRVLSRSAGNPFNHQGFLELELKGRVGRILVPADLRLVGCDVRVRSAFVVDRRQFAVGKPGTRLDALVRSGVEVELQASVPVGRFGVGCARAPQITKPGP